LIAALAQIADLKVIGRSSSFRFKGKNEESKTIGEKLGVNTLLEGTVRKQADHVRIVAELINAADGRELWSRTFDRALKDIFAIQAEIAEAVAGSLELTLLGREDKSARNASTQRWRRTMLISGPLLLRTRNPEDYRSGRVFDERSAVKLRVGYASVPKPDPDRGSEQRETESLGPRGATPRRRWRPTPSPKRTPRAGFVFSE
jgi:hypothetical protein